MSSPSGSAELLRRRYTQTLGLDLTGLEGTSRLGRLSFRSLLRLDTDFGQSSGERDPRNLGRYVPGLPSSPLDLMYAYLDADRLAGTPLGLRLGRQYQVDALGWWSFDGVTARAGDPRWLRVETYGGFEQRAALPMFALSRFTSDGVYRGVRQDLQPNVWPSYLSESKLAPAFGAAAETLQFPYLHARIAYRKVLQRDAVYVSPWANPNGSWDVYRDTRVSSEKLAGSLNLTLEDWGALDLSLVYDLVMGVWSSQEAALDWFASRQITLGLEVERYVPTFDGDSIFNYFVHQGTTSYLSRAHWTPGRTWELALSFGARQFKVERAVADSPWGVSSPTAEPTLDSAYDVLAEYGAIRRWPGGSLRFAGLTEAGETGRRLGSDVSVRQSLGDGFYDTLALVSLWDWHDALRPGRDAVSAGYVLGGGINPNPGMRFGLEWEHSANGLVGQRFRLLCTLAVRMTL